MFKKRIGNRGELIAADFYRSLGFTIEERNVLYQIGEIDIVATYGRCRYFIEVKTRTSSSFGFPEEIISEAKVQRMWRCAERYQEESGGVYTIRLEVCSVRLANKIYIRRFSVH